MARRRSESIRRFVRKHEGFLTIVGALIVFATYVVKENIEMRYKEIAETLSSAEIHFRISRELNKVDRDLQDLTTRVEMNQAQDKMQLADAFNKHDVSLDMTGVESVALLMQQLRDHHKEDDILKDVKNDVALEEKWRIDYDRVIELDNSGEKKRAEEERLTAEADEEAMAEEAKRHVALKRPLGRQLLEQLQADVLDKVSRERDKYEHLDKFWKPFSYVLFGLGWGVGLIAKLAGSKQESGEP